MAAPAVRFKRGATLFFHQAAQVAVGDDAGQATVDVEHGRHAEISCCSFRGRLRAFLRRERREGGRRRRALVFDAEEFFAEAACGMERGEIVVAEVAAFEEGDGQGVADGHGDSGAGCGREVERAGFFLDADVEGDVAGFGERGVGFAGQRDERDFQALQGFEELDDLFGFAAVGDCDQRCRRGRACQDRRGGLRRDEGTRTVCRCWRRWRRFSGRRGRTCPCR